MWLHALNESLCVFISGTFGTTNNAQLCEEVVLFVGHQYHKFTTYYYNYNLSLVFSKREIEA